MHVNTKMLSNSADNVHKKRTLKGASNNPAKVTNISVVGYSLPAKAGEEQTRLESTMSAMWNLNVTVDITSEELSEHTELIHYKQMLEANDLNKHTH